MRQGNIIIKPIAMSIAFDHFKTDLNSIEATKREEIKDKLELEDDPN